MRGVWFTGAGNEILAAAGAQCSTGTWGTMATSQHPSSRWHPSVQTDDGTVSRAQSTPTPSSPRRPPSLATGTKPHNSPEPQ